MSGTRDELLQVETSSNSSNGDNVQQRQSVSVSGALSDQPISTDVSDTSRNNGGAPAAVNYYDTSQTAMHSYLGDREDLGGVSQLLPERLVRLPMYLVRDLVVFPGETLPLRLLGRLEQQIVDEAIQAPAPLSRLIAVVRLPRSSSPRLCKVGCIAELRQTNTHGSEDLNCIAICRQRLMITQQVLVGNTVLDPLRVPVMPLQEIESPPVPREVGLGMTAWGEWAYLRFDAWKLANRARALLSVAMPQVKSFEGSPLWLSYWMASNLTFDLDFRQELLEARDELERLTLIIHRVQSSGIAEMACTSCKVKIGSSKDSLAMTDSGPGGAFVNAHGYIHDMVTISKVCCRLYYQGDPETEYSWFPGYAWTICNCVCGAHIGWRFTATKPELQPRCFWGLRISQIATCGPASEFREARE